MQKQPRVYMLHRVVQRYEETNYYFQRGTAITWKRFLALLDFIEINGWTTRKISNLMNGYRENDVFITFDDGYKDIGCALNEILRRGMTATVYPVKEFAETGFSTIDDMAHHLMNMDLKIDSQLHESLLCGRLKKLLRRISADRYQYLRYRFFNINFDADKSDLFLNENELKSFCAKGVELGIHGRSHRAFTHLSSSVLREELSDCSIWLQSLGASSKVSICFPHGKYNGDVLNAIQSFSEIFLGIDSNSVVAPIIRRIHVTEESYE